MAKPQPERKYIHGLPLPVVGSDLSLFQPRERQKGRPRKTARVMERKRKSNAYQRTFVPTRNCGLDSIICCSCFCVRCLLAESNNTAPTCTISRLPKPKTKNTMRCAQDQEMHRSSGRRGFALQAVAA